MQRRALIAGIAAFLGVFVSGSVLIALVRHADEADAPVSPSASNSATPTSPQPEPGPVVDAYLAWVPDGLPPGYGATIAQLPSVGKIAVVASDTIWMTSSSDADGNLVDEPPAPYMIPIDAIAIDPKPYARFLPPETRAIVGNLLDGQAILGQTSAKLRHLGPGSVMRFEGGSSVTVVGVLPDELVGAAEVIVNRATGGTIGVTQNRYLLFQTSAGLQPSSQQLEKRFRAVLPPGLLYPVVQVRSPGETTYLRADDDTLPPALVKRRFGEWAGRPQSVDGHRGRSDVGAGPHRDGHDPGARSRGLQRTTPPAAPWRHEGSGGAGSGVDDPLVRRMLRGTVRSVVAVGIDLAQRVGRRHRRQRRHEPDRVPARAGSRDSWA